MQTPNPALLPNPALFDVTTVAKAPVEGSIERVELGLLDPPVNGCPRHGRDVEQGGTWEQSSVGGLHQVLPFF